jgi:hypothetical protein
MTSHTPRVEVTSNIPAPREHVFNGALFRVAFRLDVSHVGVAVSRGPASAVAPRADAPEPRSFGPYSLAAAAIKEFSRRHPSRVNTACGFAYDTDHAARDRRDEDLRLAVGATLSGRAATGGHGRCPPHARATGRGGAGRYAFVKTAVIGDDCSLLHPCRRPLK